MVKLDKSIDGKQLPCSMRMGEYTRSVLEDLYAFVKHDWDGVMGYFGDEGDGKTTCALQHALYLDSTFNLDRVVFNSEQFDDAVEKAEKYQVILWDEADDLGGHWANSIVMAIKRKFKRIRSKNLIILLCTPTMFDLGMYFVVNRMRCIWHIYSNQFERGFVRFFNKSSKTYLFVNGKKYWNMYAAKPNFIDSFGKLPEGFPIDMEEYNRKKDEATKELLKPTASEKTRFKVAMILQRLESWLMVNKGIKIQNKDLEYIFDVDTRSLYRYRKDKGEG